MIYLFGFRWIEERRSRRKIVENTDNYVQDENIVNTMFFAQQVCMLCVKRDKCVFPI